MARGVGLNHLPSGRFATNAAWLAGRLTRSARRLTLHLPSGWPWGEPSTGALARLPARLGHHPHPPANQTSPQLVCQMGQRAFPAASGPSMSSAPRPPPAATGPVCPKSAPTIASPCPSRPFPVPPQRGSVDSGSGSETPYSSVSTSPKLTCRQSAGIGVLLLVATAITLSRPVDPGSRSKSGFFRPR